MLSASDLVIYGSANMQDTDSGTQGGAIDTTKRVVFTDIVPASSVIRASGSLSSDSGTVAVYGRNLGGSLINETIQMSGTTLVSGSTVFERILKMVASSHNGTLTITDTGNNSLATFESGLLEIRRPFYNAIANPSGGATKSYYEKVFVKNNNTGNDLIDGYIIESSDGTEAGGADVTFATESGLGETSSVATRLTVPTNIIGSLDDSNKYIPPATSLPFGSSIGVWMKLGLPAGTSPMNTTFVLGLSGATT